MPQDETRQEIEVTPEMIEAGAFALLENYEGGPQDSAYRAAEKVIEAAILAAGLYRTKN